jgi:hypothetical protein
MLPNGLVSYPINNVTFVRQLRIGVKLRTRPIGPLIGRAKNSARRGYG